MSSLYRREALAARNAAPYGRIVLIQPPSLRLLGAVAIAFAIVVVLFLIFGSYTRHNTVSGQLLPDAGLIKIYSPITGVVLERHVQENQQVKPGDVLFVVSGERSLGVRDSGAQAERTDGIGSNVPAASKSAELSRQLDLLDQQIETQRKRLDIGRNAIQAYAGLVAKRYVSREQLQEKQAGFLEQESQLQILERERISLSHELDLQYLVITATQAGTATTVTADVGQTAESDRPLLCIVPANSELHAELMAPSRAVGFVRPGDRVSLRYPAYPYQKFGRYGGTVSFVSKTSLPSGESSLYGQSPATGEPAYEIRVKLDRQSVDAYGRAQPLRSGMTLEADLLQDRRRLYEWVLDPLLSLNGQT
ncbi:HlyD family secretion protein [Solimonas terrae]|uniref:HlyD family efflux transporter periplasmic adaptor subunit n=1 Tax=Solimonas terrae TaxID=1396819 RepID=A0A6M2BZ89_9GAMM|nr:HlyD family efflux transporter periplasmic adaptor subunit [Solimonas terrae]NGY07057.1 HlyD family efflux transporter periplasmic adaptor subunit [Solimonas terrae]